MKSEKLNILTLFILVAFTACSFAAGCVTPKTATYVRLNVENAYLYVGETVTLEAETDGTEVIWSSDATHIAAVEGGVVTAVAAGEATIKARVGKVRAYCNVTVFYKPADAEGNLCDIYGGYFPIGAAVQTGKLISGSYGNLMSHFNSITPENNMKWKNTEKVKGEVNFDQAGDSSDKLIGWAKLNGVGVRGHCLLWYKSLPEWLHDEFHGVEYSEEMRNKAYSYIDERVETTMKHFGNDIYAWDVCNELLSNAVTAADLQITDEYPYGDIWRTEDNMKETASDWVDWYKVCGGYDYIAETFRKADEVRRAENLDVQLFYNDYSLVNPNKRRACLNLIQMLRDGNAPIDGIGMQAHYMLESYASDKAGWLKNFEDSVKAFIAAGVDVQITELDIRYGGEYTEVTEELQAEMYREIFAVCRKYAKRNGAEHGVTGITFWGVHDGSNGAWGGDQLPLIFGKDKLPKKAYYEIIDF